MIAVNLKWKMELTRYMMKSSKEMKLDEKS